jgi:hypothetical protein
VLVLAAVLLCAAGCPTLPQDPVQRERTLYLAAVDDYVAATQIARDAARAGWIDAREAEEIKRWDRAIWSALEAWRVCLIEERPATDAMAAYSRALDELIDTLVEAEDNASG